VTRFKDSKGAIKRQAACFRVFAYDDQDPNGRELRIGDPVRVLNSSSGQILGGTLTDVIWTVYLANKKASWYQFDQTNGEHGCAPGHPLRNPTIIQPDARQNCLSRPRRWMA
jgi:hypothetical protein